MIPEAAVEAAAKATHALHRSGPRSMEDHRHDARAALEAAALFMLAEAWDEGFSDGMDEMAIRDNPYRSAK